MYKCLALRVRLAITANGPIFFETYLICYYNDFSAMPKAHPNPSETITVHALYTPGYHTHLHTIKDRTAGEENSLGKTIPNLRLPPVSFSLG